MCVFSLQGFVREQMLQAVAVIVKRATLDDSSSARETLFSDVASLIRSDNMSVVRPQLQPTFSHAIVSS